MSKFQTFSAVELVSLRRSGVILRGCLNRVAAMVRPGITTKELDMAAEEFILSQGGLPAFKGYHGFPATLCISVDDECVHGIPGPRVLQEGEIVSLDGGVIVGGLYTDACVTVGVGAISPQAQLLLDTTEKALLAAVDQVKAGIHVGDISSCIELIVRTAGFSPVRSLTGHGLGSSLHQFPDIPNLGSAGTGPIIPAGTLLAIEPIVSAGSDVVVEGPDGWTLTVKDGALAAHFEHSVFVTEKGCEVIA